MKELKIFLILVIFTGIVYYGVEPYAHSQMQESVPHANFDFEQEDKSFAKDSLAKAEAELAEKKVAYESNKSDSDLEKAFNNAKEKVDYIKAEIDALNLMWANANVVMSKKGDSENGAAAIDELACTGCHKISVDDKKDAGYALNVTGFINPDLSLAGKIYDDKFLAALVLNPALAMKNNHKFNDENPHPMSALMLEDENGKINDDEAQKVADMIAYLKEVAKKADAKYEEEAKAIMKEKKVEDGAEIEKFVTFYKEKQAFLNACARCHDMRYDGLNNNLVDKDAFAKYQEDGTGNHMLEYAKNKADLVAYMGSNPPDLSIIIRARSTDYLNDFINNTQKLLPGTAMPRVGLNKQGQEEVMSYLEKVGDSKKVEREDLGVKIMIYFVILAIFAWLWKTRIWRDLH